jgi:prepilin-type N-terminal cleavage/methylation domain-containing protein
MKRLMKPAHTVKPQSHRGVTLVEVLMSLMIMSIGMSAVAVLFPISVLRSIQATQLTNAAILKHKAEATVLMNRRLVFDPDGDGNLGEHIRNQTELRYIVDPVGYYDLATGGETYSVYPTLSNANDPTLPNDNALRGLADWFGNVDTNNDGVPEPFPALPRFDGGVRTSTITPPAAVPAFPGGMSPTGGDPEEARALRYLAAALSRQGDGWETVVDAVPVEFLFADGSSGPVAAAGSAIVGLRVGNDVDLSDVFTAQAATPTIGSTRLIADPEVCRVVVFSLDQTFSFVLPLIAVDDATKRVIWSEDVNFSGAPDALEDVNRNGVLEFHPLPSEFVGTLSGQFEIGRVLLQTSKTNDYNWLLTVRRGQDGQVRGVDVVITHNTGVMADDERMFPASFPAGGTAIAVLKASGLTRAGDVAEPPIRKSGYVLDVENARWYRVSNYIDSTVTVGAVTGPGYLVDLEGQVVESSLDGAAMFLPSVIDVYPMGSVPVPPELNIVP